MKFLIDIMMTLILIQLFPDYEYMDLYKMTSYLTIILVFVYRIYKKVLKKSSKKDKGTGSI